MSILMPEVKLDEQVRLVVDGARRRLVIRFLEVRTVEFHLIKQEHELVRLNAALWCQLKLHEGFFVSDSGRRGRDFVDHLTA